MSERGGRGGLGERGRWHAGWAVSPDLFGALLASGGRWREVRQREGGARRVFEPMAARREVLRCAVIGSGCGALAARGAGELVLHRELDETHQREKGVAVLIGAEKRCSPSIGGTWAAGIALGECSGCLGESERE